MSKFLVEKEDDEKIRLTVDGNMMDLIRMLTAACVRRKEVLSIFGASYFGAKLELEKENADRRNLN